MLSPDLTTVVCCAVRRYLLIVDSMTWVFFFTAFGMIGMVNFPTVSSMKSQKCSPAEQGQVLGSISAVQSLSMCVGPLIFNNLYALTTGQKGIAFMKEHWHFVIPERWVWYVGGTMMFTAVCVATSLPDPRDVYVPGADENLSITNSEIARRIRKSPLLQGKPESEISAAIEEALEQQRQLRSKDGAAAAMNDYRRGGAVETVMSPLEPERRPGIARVAMHPYTVVPGGGLNPGAAMPSGAQADYRTASIAARAR